LEAHPKILKDGRDKLVSIAQLMCEDNVEKSEEELVNIPEEVQFIKEPPRRWPGMANDSAYQSANKA
jgi:hypothetical protein